MGGELSFRGARVLLIIYFAFTLLARLVNVIHEVGVGAVYTRFRLISSTGNALGLFYETRNDFGYSPGGQQGCYYSRRLAWGVARGFLTLRVPGGSAI